MKSGHLRRLAGRRQRVELLNLVLLVPLLLHSLQKSLTLIQCAFLSWSYKSPSLASTFYSYQTLHSSATIPKLLSHQLQYISGRRHSSKTYSALSSDFGACAPSAWNTLPHYLCWSRMCNHRLSLITSSEKLTSATGVLHIHRLAGDLYLQNYTLLHHLGVFTVHPIVRTSPIHMHTHAHGAL